MGKKEYIKKYNEIYKEIPPIHAKKKEELIDKLTDVLVMMDTCKEHIEVEGCVSEMCQGNYSIQRENPWSKSYDSKVKLMVTLMEKLDKLLPDQKTEGINKAGETFASFIAKGKNVELR